MTNSERVHELRELSENLAMRLKDASTFLKALQYNNFLVDGRGQVALLIEEFDSSLRNFELIFRPEVINPDESD